MKIADVSTFDDDVYEKIAAGVFDPDRFDLVRAGKDASEEEICELVADSTIILTDPMHFQHVTRRVIEATGNLKLIPCYTLGFDGVDIEAATTHSPSRAMGDEDQHSGSNFGELLLIERLLSKAATKKEKQAVLATLLDGFGMTCFQVSARVFFEQSMYDTIKEGGFLDGESREKEHEG